jgi:hypothetical protein
MATVTNPSPYEIYVHELGTHLHPGEVVEVDDELATTLSPLVLTIEVEAKPTRAAAERTRGTKALTGVDKPGAEVR